MAYRNPGVEFCGCCGVSGEKLGVRRIAVQRRHPDTDHVAVVSLALCRNCREQPERAWRYRWEPVEGLKFAA